MARIRTIKPEFFTSEDIVSLTPWARLLYIALWCEADREGRMAWKPRTLKMRYFPADAVDIEALSQELVDAGLVRLYGDGYAYIPKFSNHQYLNPREAQSTLPNPHASARVIDASARVQAPSVTRMEEGREGKEGSRHASVPDAAPTPPPAFGIPLNDGSEFGILASQVAEWSAAYPAVDVAQQLREMRAWCGANPKQRKTRRGVTAFVVRWLGNEQDKGGAKVRGDDPFRAAR